MRLAKENGSTYGGRRQLNPPAGGFIVQKETMIPPIHFAWALS